MIDKLNSHYSFNNPASIFDEEALTALELAGRTAAKTNEVVEDQNSLRTETETHLNNQDNTITQRMNAQDNRLTAQEKTQIPNTVKSEVQKHINNGEFDKAIDEYAGNLESRLNNLVGSIPEGSTTMDAEIIDMRTDVKNEVFASSGVASRYYQGIINNTGLVYEPPVTVGYAVFQSSGKLIESENSTATDFLPMIPDTTIHIINGFFTNDRSVCGYDKAGNYLYTFFSGSSETDILVNIPSDCYSIRITGGLNTTLRVQRIQKQYEGAGELYKDLLNKCDCNFDKRYLINTPFGITIDPTAPELPQHGINVWLKECEDVGVFQARVSAINLNSTINNPMRVYIGNPNSNTFMFFVTSWNAEGGFAIDSYLYQTDSYTLVETKSIKLDDITELIEGTTYTITVRILGKSAFFYINNRFIGDFRLHLTGKLNVGINFRSANANTFIETMSVRPKQKPYIHISLDDVNSCLADLNNNKDTYTSIFDNSIFSKLREWHLNYGAVFSLYVFKDYTFDLSDMTTKYLEEFINCSDWLKFGVHSPLATDYYNTFTDAEVLESYLEITAEIRRFAGNESIDNMPRFGFFSLNKSALINLKNSSVGIVGALTADDNRASNVGLNEQELGILQKYDSYMDYENNIYYARSTERFESGSDRAINVFNSEYLDPKNSNEYILFFHEMVEEGFTNTEKVLELIAKRGIRFDYPQNNIPII